MDKLKAKSAGLARRQRRVRAKVTGTATRPRLRVMRTNSNIAAQVIDDVAGTTLVSASSVEKGFKGGSNCDAASRVGEEVAKRAKKAGVTEVIFDRGGHIYHGRIKALADGARGAGLKF